MKQKETNSTLSDEEERFVQPGIAPGEIILGTLSGFDDQFQPLVTFSENSADNPLVAMTTQSVNQQHIGRQVALLFANGNLKNPVIMGVIHSPLQEMLENFGSNQTDSDIQIDSTADLDIDDVLVDGKKIVFEAQEEIVLKCGESSITLTRAGKILIRGKYLLNRSTGVNRIMGGSVQVN